MFGLIVELMGGITIIQGEKYAVHAKSLLSYHVQICVIKGELLGV